MRNVVLIAHISLDGFVANEQGGFENFNPSAENLEFVCSLTDTSDMLMAGRVSYQMLESYWPTAWSKPNATPSEIKYSNWYNAAEKIIPSQTLSGEKLHDVTIISENVLQHIKEIKMHGDKNILLFGSPTLFQTLNKSGLVDEYWLILYPVLFGKGIPLFVPSDLKKQMSLVQTKQLTNGEIAMNYKAK